MEFNNESKQSIQKIENVGNLHDLKPRDKVMVNMLGEEVEATVLCHGSIYNNSRKHEKFHAVILPEKFIGTQDLAPAFSTRPQIKSIKKNDEIILS